MTRRSVLGRASLLLAAPLAGCGFALRRASVMPFSAIQLSGFKANSPLEFELRRNLLASPGLQVVESAAQAQVVLEALGEQRERSVVGSTASGQVRNMNLRLRFKFRLRTVAGRELIGATELVLARDMSYNETNALAKEQEEDSIFRVMQTDIVLQVMRRLAASPAP